MRPLSHCGDPALGLAPLLAPHGYGRAVPTSIRKGVLEESYFQGLAAFCLHCLGPQQKSRGQVSRCWAERDGLVWHSP